MNQVRRPLIFLAAAAVILGITLRKLSSETLVMTTTYPSPIGIYRSMITTGGSSISPANTILNRDFGNVDIGTTAHSTDPLAKLVMGGDEDMEGYRIVNEAAPINPSDLATKAYVDAAAGGGPATWTCTVASAVSSTFSTHLSVACPGATDKVVSGGCASSSNNCSFAIAGAPIDQGWQCSTPPGGSCAPFTAYANCCH
jgi:hypothetical protein